MALSLNLDANGRIVVEPGYRHNFTAAGLATANGGAALAPLSVRSLWNPPGTGIIQLKPLQMQPDFLNHQAQLDTGCVLRLSDYIFNAADLAAKHIYEINIGTTADPWINHVPVTNVPLPIPTTTVVGLPQVPGFPSLQQVADQSETGSTTLWGDNSALPTPVPNALIQVGESLAIYPQNQGWLFRWWVAPPHLTFHQQIYAFVFGQYCALCRGALLEVYEDTGPFTRRVNWVRRYRESLFAPGRSDDVNHLNPNWPLGKQLPEDSVGHFASLMVIPVGRQKVLFLAHTGQYLIATVRAHPRRTLDGKEWDILRSDSVEVWALTPQIGQFQIQKIKYPSPAVTLFLPDIIMDYTPLITPAIHMQGDASADSQLVQGGLEFPKNYTFPASPLADDCPPPTNLTTAQQRTFGDRIRFVASTDLRVSPQLYSLEIVADPTFQNNPATQFNVFDTQGAPRVLHVETSLGSNPGDGRLTARVYDVPSQRSPFAFPLAPYQFRSEMPVQLQVDGGFNFSGYTERIEVQMLRHDLVGPGAAPIEMRFRCNDRWLLLESTILREQRDWQGVGHITVVDTIARQCGIDTGPLHPDGTTLSDGSPSMAGGSLAEYPAGWDGTLSSSYNTPLGTPIQNTDNLEGNQLAGWKPQPGDTGASFIRRITDLFSNWLVGFRSDGTLYYLPYTYFTTSTLTFHAQATGGKPVYRRPVEFRTIEPSGNFVQVVSHYQLDQTSNRSGIFVDWASLRNPKVVNYLGRAKWFILQAGGAFSCAQLNRMAYIAFQSARRRRKRVSFNADYVPTLKIGQVFTLEGLGDYRLLEMRAEYIRSGWSIANYVGEAVEKGYGLPQ